MIVRIELKFDGNEQLAMLFGNSYKTWDIQFAEYCRIHHPVSVLSAQSSPKEWIGWGGLKWCGHDSFQLHLNRVGCQHGDPDNPNPRKSEDISFKENKIVFNKASKIVSHNKK